MLNPERRSSAIVWSCFFLSGLAGLAYQIVWTRYLALFLGHTGYAVVAVLVAFMGGLALGNAWLGARADQMRRPLEFYAWLEIGIGVYALLFPKYYELCHAAFVHLAQATQPGGQALLALKFAFSLLTVFLPTLLMGATFPALTRFVTQSLGQLRGKVAALYTLNSAGAVAGCFAADFWFIPAVGLEATVFIAAGLNLVVGLTAFLLSRHLDEGRRMAAAGADVPPGDSKAGAGAVEVFSPADVRLALLGIGLSGFVAMLYEVAWTRVLGLALGSSTHAYTLMVATFITGITAGAWLVQRWKSGGNTLLAFAWAELALAAAVLLSMFVYELIPYWFMQLAGLIARRDEAYPLYLIAQMAICFLIMFVPTVCLGATLPLVSRVATASVARAARAVGGVFAVNTLGTVLGTIATGFWFLPKLGLPRTFALGVVLNAAVGLSVLARQVKGWRRLHTGLAAIGALLIFLFAGWQFDPIWRGAFTRGLWRDSEPLENVDQFRALGRGLTMPYHRDGAGSTVTVYAQTNASATNLTLKVNGKTDASTHSDIPTQLLLGHLPMLLRPATERALVIGLGSGMTAGAIACHTNVHQIHVVEISPEVKEAARLFDPFNGRVLEDPRVRVFVEDAKSFLKITTNAYDVIVSEPSNPWMAGVAGVFSHEYYEDCRRRMPSNGLMVQWIHLYESNEQALNTVLATFSTVFPYTAVWQSLLKDVLLVGSQEPFQPDFDLMQQRFDQPRVKADLARFAMTRLPALLSCELISQFNGAFTTAEGTRLHSDYFPILEYQSQRAFFVLRSTDPLQGMDERYSSRPTTLLNQYLQSHRLTQEDFRGMGEFFNGRNVIPARLLRSFLERWLSEYPNDPRALAMSVSLPDPGDPAELQLHRLQGVRDQLQNQAKPDAELFRLYVKNLLRNYRDQRSVFYLPPAADLEAALRKFIELDPNDQRTFRLLLAECAWDRGEDGECLRLAQVAFDPDATKGGPVDFRTEPGAPHVVLARMIDSLWRARQLQQAMTIVEQAKGRGYVGEKANPRDPVLELLCRKVEAYAAQASAPAKP